jgi:RNA polymerase sigma-70 factor (ECF subfamily)
MGEHLPDPVVSPEEGTDPEHEALLGDSVGLALLVVLEQLSPTERLAFVLHDVFGMPFEEIAPIIERSPVAARQLASRARRRVRGAPQPDPDLKAQRAVVDAFMAASRQGDFEGLLNILDPDVVLRVDGGAGRPGLTRLLRGREAVVAQAKQYAGFGGTATPVLVNGVAGAVAWTKRGEPFAVGSFTVRDGRIVSMEILADPARIAQLDLEFLKGP